MRKPLYDRFVAWALENYAFTESEAMEACTPQLEGCITAADLRAASAEWQRRTAAGRTPKLAAERKPVGRVRIIPEGQKCQNPHAACGGKAESIVNENGQRLFVCSACRRRFVKTGSTEPLNGPGRPRVNDGPCRECGKAPAIKKGMCDSCYHKQRYSANKREKE